MTITAIEIETIVRRVLSTLASSGAPSRGEDVALSGRLRLTDGVVSIQSLRNRLAGVQVLEIGLLAVLTPAAKDLCRELKVDIVRGEWEKQRAESLVEVKPPRAQRILVASSADWIAAVSKQLCPKQSKVLQVTADDTSTLRMIADGLRDGHQAGIAIVESPYAACWQSARDDRLRPAVVSSWSELTEVLREVPVNVLILSSRTWNVPSACNVARRFFQHLQSQS
jgi:hypothetical protein